MTVTLKVGTITVGDSASVYVDYINEDGINGSEDDDANSVSGTITITEVTAERIVETLSAALIHDAAEPNAQLEAAFEAIRIGTDATAAALASF